MDSSADVSNEINNSTSIIITNEEGTAFDSDDLFNFLRPKFEDFDLKTLLMTSPLGKSVLAHYSTHFKLDNTKRNRLCAIIVKHLYNHIVKWYVLKIEGVSENVSH